MGAAIYGQVRSTEREPVAEARVYFTHAPAVVPDIAALSDGEGCFALSAPMPGRYRVECAAEGLRTTAVSIDVPADVSRVDLVVELPRC